MINFLVVAFLLVPGLAIAQQGVDLCEVLDIKNCAGVSRQQRRSSSLSLPSPNAAAILNPSTVSFDRGVGLELMYHSSNPIAFSFVSGTGRVGAAMISPSQENSFFGNRLPELDDEFLERNQDRKRYDPNKLNLALGAKLIGQKHVGLDVGMIFKRHNKVKKINPGGGASARLGPFHLGASVFKDDFYLDYRGHEDANGTPYTVLYGTNNYSESFTVRTYSTGLSYRGLSVDYAYLQSKTDLFSDDTLVRILSSSYRRGNFMFNLATRREDSGAPKFKSDKLIYSKSKNETYAGIQYSYNKFFIFGLHHNYFLLREMAASVTLFY